jgi:hypothetical protein
MKEETAIGFVTRKVLVTFHRPICLMIGDDAVFAEAAICEYQDDQKQRVVDSPTRLVVVALPSGRKLAKSMDLSLCYSGVFAMVELSE